MGTKPKYLDKHPCVSCQTGYGECAQGATMSLMCCIGCCHPTMREPNPWSAEDIAEMEQINKERRNGTNATPTRRDRESR